MSSSDVTLLAVLEEAAWRRGSLRHLLHADQQTVYDQIMRTRGRFVMEISRRYGKTYLLCVLAVETCLKRAKNRVVFGAPTLKHAVEFIQPVMDSILEACPADLRPVYNVTTGHYDFPNGSHIVLFGADDKRRADRGRGPAAAMAIFDEAGFCALLKYVLRSVFRPQLLHSSGRIILGSTPAETPEHDFSELAEKAEASGNYARRTVWDNSRLTTQQIEQFISDDAKDEGLTVEQYMNSTDFKREYMALRVVDTQMLVIPEAQEALKHCVYDVERPDYFDAYTVLDFGGVDPHAVIFAYYHFKLAKTVIVDELLLKNGETTEQLSAAIKKKEQELWGSDCWAGTMRGARDSSFRQLIEALPPWLQLAELQGDNERAQPYARFSDNDVQLVKDLHHMHRISFVPTPKDDKELQINNLRVELNRGNIVISPKCVHTIRHIRTATWSSSKRNDYRRVAGEHADLLDTTVYLCRNIYRRNPYPANYGMDPTRISVAEALRQREKKFTMIGSSPLARRIAGR